MIIGQLTNQGSILGKNFKGSNVLRIQLRSFRYTNGVSTTFLSKVNILPIFGHGCGLRKGPGISVKFFQIVIAVTRPIVYIMEHLLVKTRALQHLSTKSRFLVLIITNWPINQLRKHFRKKLQGTKCSQNSIAVILRPRWGLYDLPVKSQYFAHIWAWAWPGAVSCT